MGPGPVVILPKRQQVPTAFRGHWLSLGNLNESEEEEEEDDDNEGDGDEEGKEEEEEEEDAEAGSEKEEDARLAALEEQRMEGKVGGAVLRAQPGKQPCLVPALA